MTVPRYPGRDRVMSRTDAATIKYQRLIASPAAHPCQDPYPIYGIGLPSQFRKGESGPLPVEMQGRCRKCGGCLAHRRRLWTARAMAEIAAAERTWFGTLTLNPESQFVYTLRAQAVVNARRCEPFSALSVADQFRYRVEEISVEITRFIKRLRKSSGVPLRYLLVSEAHKSGDPHFHLLLHEPRGAIRKALLEEQWKLGFSHWRLVQQDQRAASYACKYLAKEALTRVRASLRYGQQHSIAALTERVSEGLDTLDAALKGRNGERPPPVQK